MTTRVFLLANSYKHHPMRCVAGREVLSDEDGKARWGRWIRPVTGHDEGALRLDECCYANGRMAQPLDVADIPLDKPQDDPIQPENWFVPPGQHWKKAGEYDVAVATQATEQPPNLWVEPGQRMDRVSPAFLRRMAQRQSLYLIRPESFHLKIETKEWEGQRKKRLRGVLRYHGQTYDMGVTDPLIDKKYCPDFRNAPDGVRRLRHDDQLLLCVSLTPEFQGLHYKVVAAVLELKP